MIGFILWLVMGALVGWIASLMMEPDARRSTLLNVAVGIAGGALGGLLARLIAGSGAAMYNAPLTLGSFVLSVLGAVILLGIVRAARVAR